MSDTMSRLAAAQADRYRIERELGQGGMATVYLAQDLRHDLSFVMIRPVERYREVNMVIDWREELRRRTGDERK
jgi:serine/threonine protein kinase